MPVLFAYLHHLLAFSLVAILFAEAILLSTRLTLEIAKKIQLLDLFYGLCAMLLVAVGSLRVAYFEKGWDYYRHSPWFMAKMTLFVAVALLSAYPTLRFLQWRQFTARGELPDLSAAQLSRLRRLIYLQALGIVAIIFCAVAMAKNLGGES